LSDGLKKEIYQDVRFFHGALQLISSGKSEYIGIKISKSQ